MCLSPGSVLALGTPLFQEGLRAHSTRIGRYLSGVARNTDARSPNDLAGVEQFDVPLAGKP